ncbi:MAG TPA: hypothetical protein VFF52_15835 [Isosphaeraceae bacterium]|nr:hypothetical protein [Isosphaeraceae bacterium]
MRRCWTLLGVMVLSAIPAASARAEHAKIQLDVSTRGDQVTAFVDQTPPEWGKNPRPVLKARTNESIRIQVMFTNVYPHKTLENVVVHFFIVREGKAGQKEIPELKDDVVQESAFDLDFKPGGKAGLRTTLKIDTPGAYLVRVESRNTHSDHEHFAAIDLVVTDPKAP